MKKFWSKRTLAIVLILAARLGASYFPDLEPLWGDLLNVATGLGIVGVGHAGYKAAKA